MCTWYCSYHRHCSPYNSSPFVVQYACRNHVCLTLCLVKMSWCLIKDLNQVNSNHTILLLDTFIISTHLLFAPFANKTLGHTWIFNLLSVKAAQNPCRFFYRTRSGLTTLNLILYLRSWLEIKLPYI